MKRNSNRYSRSFRRKRGFANRLLQAAEAMAINRGYKKTLLVAKSLDQAWFEQHALESWYARHGYEVSYDFREPAVREASRQR